MTQAISLLGCVVLLVGYGLLQRGVLTRTSAWFNVLNLVGSLLLLYVAIVDRRVGFIILEAVWAVLSVPPLLPRSKHAAGK